MVRDDRPELSALDDRTRQATVARRHSESSARSVGSVRLPTRGRKASAVTAWRSLDRHITTVPREHPVVAGDPHSVARRAWLGRRWAYAASGKDLGYEMRLTVSADDLDRLAHEAIDWLPAVGRRHERVHPSRTGSRR